MLLGQAFDHVYVDHFEGKGHRQWSLQKKGGPTIEGLRFRNYPLVINIYKRTLQRDTVMLLGKLHSQVQYNKVREGSWTKEH